MPHIDLLLTLLLAHLLADFPLQAGFVFTQAGIVTYVTVDQIPTLWNRVNVADK